MKWKASSKQEAGSILRLLAKQGEPLLRKLDQGIKVEFLQLEAQRSAESRLLKAELRQVECPVD